MPPRTHTHHLEITDTEVTKTFVSWDRGEAEREWACLSLLAEHAPGIAPRPLRRETAPSGAPVVVMERLPGAQLGGVPLTAEQTTSLGATLRRMYDVPTAVVTAAGLRERLFGPSTQTDLVDSWLAEPCDLSPLADPGLTAEAVAAARCWLGRSVAPPTDHLTSVGIADLNPANVIWDGTVCRLVDFEDGGLTDPAFEVADHVEHLGGRRDGTYDVDALVDAVGLTDDERERMRGYRPLWAAFWLAMLLPGNGGFDRNPAGTTERQARHLLGLLDPAG